MELLSRCDSHTFWLPAVLLWASLLLDLEWIWAESEKGKIVKLEQGVEAEEKGNQAKNQKGSWLGNEPPGVSLWGTVFRSAHGKQW